MGLNTLPPFLKTILSLTLLFSFSSRHALGDPGDLTEITNLDDPEVVSIAEFAVTTYNLAYQKGLSFVKVVRGEKEEAIGSNYWLVIAAKDDSETKNYDTVVFVSTLTGWHLGSFDVSSFEV